MFTQQAQDLASQLIQSGMPLEWATILTQAIGNCAQPLLTNAPVNIDTTLPASAADGGMLQPPAAGQPSQNATEGALNVNNYSNDSNPAGPYAINVQNGVSLFQTVVINGDLIINNLRLTTIDVVTDIQYNSTTHTFQYKTKSVLVFDNAPVTAFTDWGGTQPVAITPVDNVRWDNASSGVLDQEKLASTYVLESGAAGYTTIDTATLCP